MKHDAVIADRHFGDRGDAVLLAVFDFAVLDLAAGIGDVRAVFAHAGAEQFQTTTGAGRFDDRRLELAGLAEFLGDRGRERIDSRRTDDVQLVAGLSGAGGQDDDTGGSEGERDSFHGGNLFWVKPSSAVIRSLP